MGRALANRRNAERTIDKRWPISQAARQKLLSRLLKVIDDKTATHRDTIDVGKVLLSADKLNLEGIRARIELEGHEEMIERVAAIEDAVARAQSAAKGQTRGTIPLSAMCGGGRKRR
jgi:hypothetical protein